MTEDCFAMGFWILEDDDETGILDHLGSLLLCY